MNKKYSYHVYWIEEPEDSDGDGGYWFCYHPDFGQAGCSGVGRTPKEAIESCDFSRADVLDYRDELGKEHPEVGHYKTVKVDMEEFA